MSVEGIGFQGNYEPVICEKDAEDLFVKYNIFALNAYKNNN